MRVADVRAVDDMRTTPSQTTIDNNAANDDDGDGARVSNELLARIVSTSNVAIAPPALSASSSSSTTTVAPSTNANETSSKLLTIVCAQRDRLQQRVHELEVGSICFVLCVCVYSPCTYCRVRCHQRVPTSTAPITPPTHCVVTMSSCLKR